MKTGKGFLFGLAMGAVAVVSLLSAPGVAEENASNSEFVFGCALPLTGMFGQDGQMLRDAYTY
jgi:putative exporter of polyketide antibiotics